LHHLGGYDVFTAIGVTLVALGGTPALTLLGGVVLGATNAEQGVAAVICGALVYWAIPSTSGTRTTLRDTVSRFAASLIGLALSRVGVLIWFHAVGATVQSRFDEFGQLLAASLENAASLGATGIYSWLAAGWVMVVAVLWQLRERELGQHGQPQRWVAAGVGLVILPAIATVTTLDGSRVFGAVGGVALMVALVWFSEMSDRPEGKWILKCSAALMIFGILIPTIVTTYRGGIRVPWRFILNP
jgi:hypothetical protein